ncbi:MAG: hypothetical protein CVV27_09765 [Candidatus Melainabacteria bacterium HGW-Melainabacteria-1]|nr:MAG: hypothetical protein CVV27_09765 [Candidatus Melainabacteria bacterium HGW-Melainabacteria-1]
MNKFLISALALLSLGATPTLAQTSLPVQNADPSRNLPGLGGPIQMRGIPFNSNRLFGLPSRWADEQYRQYGLSVLALNRVLARGGPSGAAPADQALALQLFNRQALSWRFLESLGGQGLPTQSNVLNRLQAEGLDLNSWQARVLALAAQLKGGSGWIIWEYNLLTGNTGLYAAQDDTDVRIASMPLLVMNLNQQTYQALNIDQESYTRLLLNNLNWESVSARLNQFGLR